MSERSDLFKKLRDSLSSRKAYTKAMVSVNVASQIKALRIRRSKTQKELATEAGMKQARISVLERPGEPVSLETLTRLAAAFRVGLVVKFVPFSEMFAWKHNYSQDTFDATPIEEDFDFVVSDPFSAMYRSSNTVSSVMSFSTFPTEDSLPLLAGDRAIRDYNFLKSMFVQDSSSSVGRVVVTADSSNR